MFEFPFFLTLHSFIYLPFDRLVYLYFLSDSAKISMPHIVVVALNTTNGKIWIPAIFDELQVFTLYLIVKCV